MAGTDDKSDQAPSWRDATEFEAGEVYDADARAGDGDGDGDGEQSSGFGGLWIGAALAVVAAGSLALGGPLLVTAGAGVALLVWAGLRFTRGGEPEERRVAAAPGVDVPAATADLAAAEAEVTAMEMASEQLSAARRGDVAELAKEARSVLDGLAADPQSIRRLRKFLKVYLPSARASIEKYAALGVIDAELEERFGALLTDMIATCRRQRDVLSEDDRLALEIEMEVLADRLRAESPR